MSWWRTTYYNSVCVCAHACFLRFTYTFPWVRTVKVRVAQWIKFVVTYTEEAHCNSTGFYIKNYNNYCFLAQISQVCEKLLFVNSTFMVPAFWYCGNREYGRNVILCLSQHANAICTCVVYVWLSLQKGMPLFVSASRLLRECQLNRFVIGGLIVHNKKFVNEHMHSCTMLANSTCTMLCLQTQHAQCLHTILYTHVQYGWFLGSTISVLRCPGHFPGQYTLGPCPDYANVLIFKCPD